MLTLENGRPDNGQNRLDKELKTYDFLDNLGIKYERVDHEPAMTIAACEEIEKILNTTICKNLFLCNTQKTNFYLLIMPGNKKFQTKLVSKQLEIARLSFASEDFLLEYMDLTPGSVTLMGLINDKENKVRLLVDKELLECEYFACHPCINTSSIKFKTTEVFDTFLKAVHHEPTFLDLGNEYL